MTTYLPISRELLDDAAVDIGDLIQTQLDRIVNPWRYPDRNPMPTFVLWPRIARLEDRWRHRGKVDDDWDDDW